MATRTDYRSRLERAVTDVVARALVVFPLAWMAMLIDGATRFVLWPYWRWVLYLVVAMGLGEGTHWVWRRIRKRAGA